MSKSRTENISTVHPFDTELRQNIKKLQRRRSIVHEFALNTTAHGLPGIARSQSAHNRVFWSISTVVFAGVMLYFVIESIRVYFEYFTQTSVVTIVEWPQYFPAFSICNLSPIRYDQFIKPFINYTISHNLTNTNNSNSVSSDQKSLMFDFMQFTVNQNGPLEDLMYPLTSMLIQCKYNELNCTAADFITFISPTYGLCYTFNAKVKNTRIRYLNDNGGYGKLELRLYAHSHQYVPLLTDSVGMVGMIHDNTQLPLIDIAGLHLGSGRKHKLCFAKKTNFLLGPPYSTCTDKVTLALKAMFGHFDNAEYAYSQLNCMTVCMQAYTYQQCGCVSAFKWSARSVVLPGTNTIINASVCNIANTCYITAADKLMSTKEIRDYFCADCQQECSSIDYPVKISSASAPPEWLLRDIKAFVENSSIPLPSDWFTSWSTHIKDNYVAVDVVRESILVENYTQQATLSGVDVLSNVGGQTGLWIGISFLSLMEIAEMLYRLIRYQFYVFRAVGQQN